MQIELNRASAQPLYMQVAQDIQRRIRSGALPLGTRLPTVRDLAQQLGVTRLTIHSAYSELQAGGWVEATVGRGTFVAMRTSPLDVLPSRDRDLSSQALLSDMMRMTQLPGLRSLATADPAADSIPTRELKQAFNEALSGGPALFGYGPVQGDPLLRKILADITRDRGLQIGPDEILVTQGATQALSLICQTLCRPGDVVLVEQPTYLGMLNVLQAQGVQCVGVPLDSEGIQLDILEGMIIQHRPRFLYTIPTYQNPTGTCMSAERRKSLIALSQRYRLPIVEDDIYGRLPLYETAPLALKAEDREGLVIYLTSFSKILAPSLRLGYIVATPELITRIQVYKQTADLCSSALMQHALALFLQQGRLAPHLRKMTQQYRERCDSLLDAMSYYFPSGVEWSIPRGGFSCWVSLPASISTTDLYLAAIEQGVSFTPGDVFFQGPAPRPYMRLSFATQTPEVLHKAVSILGSILNTQLARRMFRPVQTPDYVPLV
jgi:2-aminoadipate transaminase